MTRRLLEFVGGGLRAPGYLVEISQQGACCINSPRLGSPWLPPRTLSPSARVGWKRVLPCQVEAQETMLPSHPLGAGSSGVPHEHKGGCPGETEGWGSSPPNLPRWRSRPAPEAWAFVQ